MPDFGEGVRYGSEGAQIGSTFSTTGTAIGGGIGFLAGLFGGKSEEDVNSERFRQFLDVLSRMKKETLNQTAQSSSGFLEQATANARRRAAAAGLKGADVNANIIPAQSSAARSASEAQRAVNQQFNQAEINATAQFEGRPIPPSALDYAGEFGGAVAKQLNFEKYLDVIGGKNSPVPADISQVPGQTNPKYYVSPGIDYRGGSDGGYLMDVFK